MKLPKKLLINRIEDYHTHYLGETDDGRLFWGYETFVEDWRKFRKEYAILHIFDKKGNHLETKFHSQLTIDGSQIISDKLHEFITDLGTIRFRDIKIKLFQTTIDHIVFGLIPDEEFESIALQPSSTISFQEPWDGQYYT